jgi:hypothetical protein
VRSTAFLVDATVSGVCNAVGPVLRMADVLVACREATRSDQRLVLAGR